MKRVILILFLALSYWASAQENYLPGYILTTEKDTMPGYIDYQNWKINPESVSFKKELNAAPIVYWPLDISGFSVADEYYETSTVEVEVSPEKVNELTYEVEFKVEDQTAFLQCLIRGDKSLYYLVNRSGKDNFYIKKGGKYELLLYKQYARNVNYARQVIENKKYQGQLSLYLNNCSEVQSKLVSKKYQKKDLIKIFEFYYTCVDQKPDFAKKSEKITSQFGILTGVKNSKITVASSNPFFPDKTKYENSFSTTGGMFLTLVLPRNLGKFAIQNELLYTSYNFEGNHLQYQNEDVYTKTQITLKAKQLKLNILARMRIPVQKIALTFDLGISNAHAFSPAVEKITTTKLYSPERSEKSELDKIRTYEQGIVGGLGVVYSQFSFTTRYEISTGVSKGGTRTTLKQFYFMLGYRITK